MSAGRWRFWIDRGGTFTDGIGRDPATGQLHVAKVLSSDTAPLAAMRAILGLAEDAPIPPSEIRMGTTVATNALLERRGASVGLVITRGFRDALEIATQARPHLFDLDILKPERLYAGVLEVDARADAEGRVLARPDPAALREGLSALFASGVESLAVVVLHGHRCPELEREIAAAAREVGFLELSLSHEVAAEIGLVGRGDTTLVDAYLTPLIRAYVRALSSSLPGSTLAMMQSSGGLADASAFRGRDAILSGPAGGVIAYAEIARARGLLPAIGLDMGGTSTDVSRFAGELERVYETETAGVRVRAPMLSIHTVAAGGGSICRFDGERFTIGPDSAGARPGPLAYGDPSAEHLTITDVNLVLGRLRPERFPFPLDLERPRAALARLQAQLPGRSIEAIAEGFLEVANATMAEAILRVSVARGFDVRDHTLVLFGGAAGQHGCALARRLGIRRVLLPPFAGVLSALGMGLADSTWHGELDADRRTLQDDTARALEPLFGELEARGRAVLTEARRDALRVVRRVALRYRGTETSLALAAHGDLRAAFEAEHTRTFGYARPDHPIEVVAARLEVVAESADRRELLAATAPEDSGTFEVVTGSWGRVRSTIPGAPPATQAAECGAPEAATVSREELRPRTTFAGPVTVLDATGTLVVDAGFRAEVHADGSILLVDLGAPPAPPRDARRDPVRLEIYHHRFMSIAEQMGEVLKKTAFSTNIRERLDFSCAVFDADGGLVANAPHIPVHLGAMSASIRGLLDEHPDPRPGEAFAMNDPARGGSHLPDVTVVTPVHDAQGARLFFVANRGHHADVGGTTPGSMPPFSKSLAEEGVVLRNVRILAGGRLDERAILDALEAPPFPARAPRDNLKDLEAQLAANAHGARLLHALVAEESAGVVAAYMRHIQDNAESMVRRAIAALPSSRSRFADRLDDGTPIVVELRVEGDTLAIDFTGTGPASAGNLNAPRAVTSAAILYVLRTLVGAPIPLNGGCFAPVRVIVPEGTILSPGPACAVAGGNVETSQRVVDVLLGALGLAAASQGTMNNLTFGDATFGYYETIAGGAGATKNRDGASAVHTHMTNTRITDAEVLESRFPVRVLEFSIRRGSGGRGARRGGDGVVRELEMLRPVTISILSERRAAAPYGLSGGEPGARGRNLLSGRELAGKLSVEAPAGARLRVETPGGGGFGELS